MKLGDTHNFGKFVQTYGENWVLKPRTTEWEQLFFSKRSWLRKLITDICLKNNISNPFSVIPALEFRTINQQNLVEKFDNQLNTDAEINTENVSSMASVLALLTWFGVSDLHVDNVKVGFNSSKNFYIVPFDIESIFNAHILPSETWLIPPHKKNCKMAGFESIKFLIVKNESYIKAFLKCYIDMFLLLDSLSEIIETKFKINSNLINAPIRVIIRNTQDYQEYLKNRFANNNFLIEELIQLHRNDVPYFYRKLSSPGKVYYFIDPELSISIDESNELALEILTRIENRSFIKLNSNLTQTCIEAGSLEIFAWLMRDCSNFKFSDYEFNLQKNHSNIKIVYHGKVNVEANI